MLSNEVIKDLEDLVGTCLSSIDFVLEEHGLCLGSISIEDAYAIDEIVFCCCSCGWHAGPDERNDASSGWICNQCYGEENPEEE